MPWFLVDDDFTDDERVLAVSLAARGLWMMAGTWASRRHTDVVPQHVLASLGSTSTLVNELTAARMLKRNRGGTYRIVQEGLCRIATQETVDKSRKQKAERQNRWRERQRRRPVDASTDASPLDPDPDPRSVVDVVNHVADRYAREADDNLIQVIKQTIRNQTRVEITDDWALKIARGLLNGHNPKNRPAYCRRAIENERDPRTRFLPNGGRP